MTPEEIKRRYVRQPSEASKPTLGASKLYWAYDKDGHNKGQVRLGSDKKKWYEERGYTFKAVYS